LAFSMSHSVALSAGRKDGRGFGQTVEKSSGQFFVPAKDAGPFTEVEVGGDNHRLSPETLAQEIE